MSTTSEKRSPEEEPFTEKVEEKPELEKKTLYEKICYLKSNITVEPTLAGLIIPSTLSRLAIQNLNLDKACRVKHAFGDTICDALIDKTGNYTNEETEIQQVIAIIESWKSIMQTALPTLIVICMGAWSDRTGNRKLCILLPLIGELLVSLSNIISVFFFYEISVEVTMFMEGFFEAITGGYVTVFLGVFSYISDITDEKNRTFRVGMVNLCMTAGIPVGTALSGVLLKWWGYYGIFSITAALQIMTILYAVFYLKSCTKPPVETDEKEESSLTQTVIAMVKDTVMMAFKKREGGKRSKIILTLFVVGIIYGPNHGEHKIMYLFMRHRLRWDAIKYSIYSTYNIIVHSLGALFSISVFSKKLGFHDSMLCLISSGSKLVGSFCTAFVYTDFHIYMVCLVQILNATTFTSLRSMASKLVPSEEMGKMNSIFSLVETLGALMFDPAYNYLYSASLRTFTGSIFIYSALLTVPPIIALIWLFVQHRKEEGQKRRMEEAEKL